MRSNPHVCLHSSTIFSISKYCDTIRNSLCCYAFSKLAGIWRETLAMIQQYYKITTSIVHHSQLSNIFFFHYFRPVHQLVSRSFSFRHDSAFLHCIIIPRWVQKNLERFFTPKILRIVVCATLQKKSSKFQSIFVQFCKSVIFSMGPQTHRDSKLESTSSFRGVGYKRVIHP